MKIFLTTFASSDLKSSVKRFRSQAEQLGIYDRIFIFNENDLNDDFNKYVSSLIKKGKKRGYGYFVWQCFFHKLVLNQINTNDIYHWCDVGCHFNYNGLKRLKEYINIVNNSDNSVLSFQYKDPDFKNDYALQKLIRGSGLPEKKHPKDSTLQKWFRETRKKVKAKPKRVARKKTK